MTRPGAGLPLQVHGKRPHTTEEGEPAANAGGPWIGRSRTRSGTGLPGTSTAWLSAAFGTDLSDVEVHPEDAGVADRGARAATVGPRIGFAPGAYQPGTAAGDRLIAHEIAHVVQQRGSAPRPGPQHDAGGGVSRHEAEARTASRLAVAGHRVPRLSPSPVGQPQMGDGKDEPSVAPVRRTTLAADYPGLEAVLGDPEWDALEAAYERRLDVVAPSGAPAASARPARTGGAGVAVPLRSVVSDRLTFVDVDVWATIHAVLQAGGGDELVGELLRNEMIRRFVARLPITLDSTVAIAVADPLGTLGGPNHLEYRINGSVVGQTHGLIDPLDLDAAFGRVLDPIIQAVAQQGYKVALSTALLDEVPALTKAVHGVRSRMDGDPGDVALGEIRGLQSRVQADRGYLAELKAIEGWAPAGVDDLAGLIDVQDRTVADLLQKMLAHRSDVDPGRALGEYNEEAAVWLAGTAAENWDEGGAGGKVVGGLAYAGAFGVAMVDAAESLLSFGYHETAIDVSQAWQRGDISYNELEDILAGAAFRAIVVAAVTRGLGAATSRVGAGVASRFGLAQLSLARATVTGAVSGGLTGPASLAAHHLLTRGWAAAYDEGSAAQGIIERGIPGPKQYAFATGAGIVLGGLGGRARMEQIHRGMEGRITATPSGPMRILRVDPSGAEVLGPIGTRSAPAAGAGRGAVIDLEPTVRPDGTVVYLPTGVVDSPVGPMRPLASGANGAQLVVPSGGPIEVPPGALRGVEIVLVPHGWRPSPEDAARLLPAPSDPRLPVSLPGSGGPLQLPGFVPGSTPLLTGPAAGGTSLVPMPSLPTRSATGRQVVSGYLQQLAAGRAGPAADLVQRFAATRPRPPVDWSLLSPFDPFRVDPFAPLRTPFDAPTVPGGSGPGRPGPGLVVFPALTGGPPQHGTSLVVPSGPIGGTGVLTVPPPSASPLLLPAPGQTSISQVLAQLPPVDVVTPDTLVWANTRSGVYHVQGSSRFRSGTREGVLSTVAEAEAAGYRQAGVAVSAGPNVTFEGPAARGEPRHVFTGRVSPVKGARGAQNIVPSAGEYPSTAPVADTHRMHPAARDLGFTPTSGYRLGPDYVNTVWDRHIEKFIKQLDQGSRASDEIWMTTTTFTVPGTSRLHSKTYQVWAQDATTGRRTQLFELSFEVDWKQWIAHPTSQPPPRVTVDYVNEAKVDFLSGFSGSDR